MPTDNISAVETIAYIVISALSAYGAGRIHQWYKHGLDRDRSFRDGYKHGYHALFPLASRCLWPALDVNSVAGRGEPAGPDEQAPESFQDSGR
jgi:hypothetical protein